MLDLVVKLILVVFGAAVPLMIWYLNRLEAQRERSEHAQARMSADIASLEARLVGHSACEQHRSQCHRDCPAQARWRVDRGASQTPGGG